MRADAARGGARGALLLLTAVYALSYLDRQVVGLVLEPLKAALGAGDAQMGLLTGPAFAVLYGALGLPLAELAGRWGPRRLIAVALAVFAAATCACAAATTFLSLFLLRVTVGIGEAGTTPASHALIAALYPAPKRPGALAIWTLGAQVGILAGFGLVALVIQRFGWRSAFLVAGVPGLVLAAALPFALAEPAQDLPRPGAFSHARALWRRPAYRDLVLALAAILFAVNADVAWVAALLHRSFGLSLAQAALSMGLAAGGLGAVATLGAGRWGALARARGPEQLAFSIGRIMGLTGCLWTLGLLAPASGASLVLLLAAAALNGAFQGPFFALLQETAPADMRASASALALTTGNVVGAALGPLVAGAASQALSPSLGQSALPVALAACNLAYIPAVVMLSRARRGLSRQTAG